MSENKKNIYQKIHSVMSKIGALSKDKKNTQQQYKYVSAEHFISSSRDLMIEEGLVVSGARTRNIQMTSNAKGNPITTASVEYTIADIETGKTVSYQLPAQGFDTTDKGAYKLITGSFKYFLRVAFMIEMTDDPEKETKIDSPSPENADLRARIFTCARKLKGLKYNISPKQQKDIDNLGTFDKAGLETIYTSLNNELKKMEDQPI